MKKLIILLALLCITLGPIPASPSEDCNGNNAFNIAPGENFSLCWDKNTIADGYKIYQSSVSGQKGIQIGFFKQEDCSENICDTGALKAPLNEGVYFYTVTAHANPREITYDKFNTETKQYEKTTRIVQAEESGPSNEVDLIVTVFTEKPPSPSGCSIRKFIP